MRIKLTLDHRPRATLPINYNYFVSAWIYHTLGQANQTFATWLHEQGYEYGGKRYKLFTFSMLQPQRFEINRRDRTFILAEPTTTLFISFYLDKAVEHFVMGLFQDQQFSLGNHRHQVDFTVRSVEMVPKSFFAPTMHFRAITPVCISRDEAGKTYAQYVHPYDEEYPRLLKQNLVRKHWAKSLITQALHDSEAEIPFVFEVMSKPHSKLWNIKGLDIKGYLYNFKITTDPALLELGYDAGFGEKNSSLGMGYTDMIARP